jgi:hypothetical protein
VTPSRMAKNPSISRTNPSLVTEHMFAHASDKKTR